MELVHEYFERYEYLTFTQSAYKGMNNWLITFRHHLLFYYYGILFLVGFQTACVLSILFTLYYSIKLNYKYMYEYNHLKRNYSFIKRALKKILCTSSFRIIEIHLTRISVYKSCIIVLTWFSFYIRMLMLRLSYLLFGFLI